MIARSRKRETVGYDLRCCRCMSCRWTLGPRGTPLFQHYSHLLSWNGALPATPIVFAFLFENPKKEALATEKRDKKRGLYYIWNRILWTTQYSTWSFRQEDSPLTNKRSTCCNAAIPRHCDSERWLPLCDSAISIHAKPSVVALTKLCNASLSVLTNSLDHASCWLAC